MQQANFSQLNTAGLTSDHFNFHLQRLVKEGLVNKRGTTYTLTSTGLELAGRLDSAGEELVYSPKLGVALFVYREGQGGVEFLLHTRAKAQSYGLAGCITEKVHFGESFQAACERGLLLETGLRGEFVYAGLVRHLDKRDDEITNDVVLIIFKCVNPVGDLLVSTAAGTNEWLSLEELPERKGLFTGILPQVGAVWRGEVVTNIG